ncbi:MAG: hypothetical protein N4A61_07700 [Pelagimonas sp.]|jgi:hypothetical protein|nr:hypothetical protein [Pelagimonas sp.]
MSELKRAILDARYVDMISLGDFIARDCGIPDVDADGNLMPQATEIAASLFRWAAEMPLEDLGDVLNEAAQTAALHEAEALATAAEPTQNITPKTEETE